MAAHEDLTGKLKYDRNVNMVPTLDPYSTEVREKKSQLPKAHEKNSKNRKIQDKVWKYDQDIQNEVWKHDYQRCEHDNEALFQHTLMMAMIDRPRLFWNRASNRRNHYDFSADRTWMCPAMPTKQLRDGKDAVIAPRPRPDLCVSFHTDEVASETDMGELPAATRALIQFEGSDQPGPGERAFAFLTIEAKNSYKSLNDPKCLQQCLNSASQALHNMYQIFHEAHQETIFYNRIRVFTVSAMSQGILIRIHRAKELQKEDKQRIDPDYPLKFEFEEYARFDGQYSRQKVVDVFENIIWGYGSELFKDLKTAVTQVAQIFREDPKLKEDRNEAYYRCKQTGGRYRKDKSAAPSRANTDSIYGGAMLQSQGGASFDGTEQSELMYSFGSNGFQQMNRSKGKRRRTGQELL